MEKNSTRAEPCQEFLHLMPNERDWLVRDRGLRVSDDKKLELRLAPPGDWLHKEKITAAGGSYNGKEREEVLSLGCLSEHHPKTSNPPTGTNRGFLYPEAGAANINENQNQKITPQKAGGLFPSHWSPSPSSPSAFQQSQQQQKPAFLQFQRLPSVTLLGKESSQTNGTKGEAPNHERKAASPANPAAPSSTQTRTASAPVVGWPPIRSFRKNLASSSSKPALENGAPKDSDKPENCKKGLFVKINMDGVPIGRKVDLKAYDSYVQLSSAVDDLFRDLLAAQGDSLAGGIQKRDQAIIGLLDGSGEYILVYEDNEGDRMLVGDVPWDMFVSTVKRLRVLKSSELSTMCQMGAAVVVNSQLLFLIAVGSCKQDKASLTSGAG
ncbi:hypothetical protein ACLOJK_040114 [Asimina triloba]